MTLRDVAAACLLGLAPLWLASATGDAATLLVAHRAPPHASLAV